MDAALSEWLNLVLRWAHVIAGIGWIGSSFFFMWLDANIAKPEAARPGVEGELWMVHSGGFYRVEKILVAPAALPPRLHWFKWEAAMTWITGVFLLGLVYYIGSGADFLDPPLAFLGSWGAAGAGVALLALAWVVYDALCRSPLGRTPVFGIAGFVLMLAVAYVLSRIMSAHAAFIHVGAILGTLMTANVWMIIIPSQRELVGATKAGRAPDANFASRAKQRSVHNNAMTLPVVFIMLSSHYPSIYGHDWNWLLLAGLALVGAAMRRYLNLLERGDHRVWMIPAMAGAMAVLFVLANRF